MFVASHPKSLWNFCILEDEKFILAQKIIYEDMM